MSLEIDDDLDFAALEVRAPSPRVLDAIVRDLGGARTNALAANLPKKRPLGRPFRLALSFVALLGGAVLTSISALGEEAAFLLLGGGAASLLLGGALLGVTLPGRGDRPTLTFRRLFAFGLALGALIVLGLHAEAFTLEAMEGTGLGRALGCGIHSLLAGVVSTGVLFAIWRRVDPFSPGTTGAILGVSGGIIATIAIEASCPAREGMHLLLGHGAAVILLTALGALVGRRLLSP